MKTFEKSFIKKKRLEKASAKETFRKSLIKAQSAMEYLMTYGWAILIIAVVLGALFQLGVFNANNFAPKAPPGSCQVFRPNGPGTTSFINLEGICSGELPQYVANFSQSPAGYIVANGPSEEISQITVVFWIKPVNNGYWGNPDNYWENAISSASGVHTNYYFFIEAGENPPQESWSIYTGTEFRNFPGVALAPNTWQQLVGVYNGNDLLVYLNGNQIGSPVAANGLVTFNGATISGEHSVANGPYGNPVSGNLANIQIYNTALSANEIQSLYLEGIGGAPIDLQNLAAWWPLNGNANDYSGNGYNGQIYNVTFVSNWWSGYTPP